MRKSIFKTVLVVLVLASMQLNATTFGKLENGLPVIQISFSDLQNAIHMEALKIGYASGTLQSYEIVNEPGFGYSFKYVFLFTELNGISHRMHTGIPLILKGNVLEEEPIQIGGRVTTTCKGTNCYGGCILNNNDCTPPCPHSDDDPSPKCEKTQSNSNNSGGDWVSAAIAIINFIRGLK